MLVNSKWQNQLPLTQSDPTQSTNPIGREWQHADEKNMQKNV